MERMMTNNSVCKKIKKSWDYGIGRTALAAFSAHSVSISIGMSQGYSAILLPQLADSSEFNVTSEESSWLASLGVITNPVGSILSGVLAEYLGRKRSIQISSLPFLVGWLCIGASKDIWGLYVGRLISGIAAGMSPACYTYVSEISPPEQRGIFQALGPISASFGILITYILGYFFHWSVVAYTGLIFAMLTIFTMQTVPESPPYLAKVEKKQECFDTLLWLKRSNALAQTEYDKYMDDGNIPEEESGFKKKYVNRSTIIPFLILIGLFFLQQASGIYIILFYAVDFFKDANLEVNEYVASIIVGAIRLLMSIIAAILIDRFGRKVLCISSNTGMATSLLIIGIYTKYYEANLEKSPKIYPLLPLVCILFNVLFSMVGMLPIPWILAGELFPLQVRSIMSGVVICIAQTFIFIAVKVYPDLTNHLHFSGTVFVFLIAAITAIFFVKFLLPETKNKSLEEIEKCFRKEKTQKHFCGVDNQGFVIKPEVFVEDKIKSGKEFYSVEINHE